MAFHFSLNGLLRLRESLERAELQRLQAIAAAVVATRAELEAIEKQIAVARQRIANAAAANGVMGAELHFELAREASSVVLRLQLMKKLLELEQRRKEQLARFMKARMQREILSNLRERQLTEYDREQSRREQQRIDELFLIRNINSPSK